jgi:hypothetical protein
MRAAILLALTIALTGTGSSASCRRESPHPKEVLAKRTPPPPSRGAAEANTSNEGDPFAAILRIRVEELATAIREDRVIVVDIREVEDYEEEHIKGAVSIPLEEIRERGPKELPPGKLIVTYCA